MYTIYLVIGIILLEIILYTFCRFFLITSNCCVNAKYSTHTVRYTLGPV